MRAVSPVRSSAWLGALLFVLALGCGAAAAGLARRAAALPEPDLPAGTRVPGRVEGVLASPCQTRPRGMTCYRPVVRYTAGGVATEIVSRNAYTPNPYPQGTTVEVTVLPDGGVWLAPEWDQRVQAARDLAAQSRTRYRVFAGLFGGCAVFFALIGAGLVWFVDRSDDQAQAPPSA